MGDITKRDPSEFLGLLVPNQRRIQAFILTLVPNVADAEDIYQETLSEMWNKFDSFEVGTDFVA
jgi:RNA polymerase sigma-70 factor (ECF subfamily)